MFLTKHNCSYLLQHAFSCLHLVSCRLQYLQASAFVLPSLLPPSSFCFPHTLKLGLDSQGSLRVPTYYLHCWMQMNNLVNKIISSGTLIFQCFYLKSELFIENLSQ
jgi:hypothetical protein